MDMELSDYKFPSLDYLGKSRILPATGNEPGSSFKSAHRTAANVSEAASTSTRATLEPLSVTIARRRAPLTDDMSLSESELTNTSIPTTYTISTNTNSRHNLPTTTTAANASSANPADDEDEDTHSMEISSISID